MKRTDDRGAFRRRALGQTALSSALLKATLATAGAALAFAPEAAADCTQAVSTAALTCNNVGPGAIVVGTFSPEFPNPGSVTVSNSQFTTPGTAILIQRDDVTTPLTVTLDPMVTINVNNLAGQPAAFGLLVQDQQFRFQQIPLTVNSAAKITLNSNFTAPTRATILGQQFQIDNSEFELYHLRSALPNLGLIVDGVPTTFVGGPLAPDFQRYGTLALANCFVGDPGRWDQYGGNLCIAAIGDITNRDLFERQVNAAIAREAANVDYWNDAAPPDLFLRDDFIPGFAFRAGIYADSKGISFNPPGGTGSGNLTLNHSGEINTFGDLAQGIIARTRTLHGDFVTVGNITLTNTGIIHTEGNASAGILTYSESAIGNVPLKAGDITISGNGGITTEGSSSYGIFAKSMSAWSDYGGGDAAGGDGGRIGITYDGRIATLGRDAVGVWAESRGGRGGFGDDANIGGSSNAGSFGGHGGQVDIIIQKNGSVVTTGDRAHAVFAESVGGDGGGGGEGLNIFRLPSRGGGGGNGGVVNVTNSGLLSTGGQDAFGILASSLAGPGGFGSDDDGGLRPGRGAQGGPAGQASAVTVRNEATGMVQTLGDGSIGMFAQSVGGLGGAGGRASSAFDPQGGVGGTAAHPRCQQSPFICPNGGAVTMVNAGMVATDGDFAQAVFGQSIGGGGGLGGRADGWFFIDGGDGGDAGKGGLVDITNTGSILTDGDYSVGLFAQSVGGGGGAGGDAFAAGNLAAVSLGGDGGAGGAGGVVTVKNNALGVISTHGTRADGIFAQSVGGGGGSGGSATSFSVGGGLAASISIGGSGGGGGSADKVTVENRGQIQARGDYSNGILAQSVGGGGGTGGAAFSFAASVGIEGSLAVSVGVGGKGGLGGDGNDVLVQNFGGITTYDFNAFGILAQSVGGGGGAGGASTAMALSANVKKGAAVAVSVAVGGVGGAAGSGKLARVENKGSIVTMGDQSTGVFAQSVGGGGGVGGDASASTETISGGKSNDVKVDVSVGGAGGAAGDGGLVEVVNEGSIITLGYMANGITGQSVGGGGGIGGAGEQGDLFDDLGIPDGIDFEVPEGIDNSEPDRDRARDRYRNIQTQSKAANRDSDSLGRSSKKGGKDDKGNAIGVGIGIGGNGGAAGNGKKVDIRNIGEIITGGRLAMGIYAQSVGGGGGEGGGGSADGSGDIGVGVGMGGSGGGSGVGGEVHVANTGDITTLQEESFGIFAQSVGGGGGLANVGAGAGEEKHNFKLSIGGKGADGGKGDLVDVDQTGDILTLGRAAVGVYAQSVGGGGGYGGSAEQDAFLSVSLGGLGGKGGNGGAVDVDVSGNITTEGDFAHGVLAQSVGGGGGVGGGIKTTTYVHTIDAFGSIDIDTGLTVGVGALGLSGNGGASGDGGKVIVNTAGTITTLGDSAHGIIAQSIAGGGGMGGSGGASLPAAYAEAGSNGGKGAAETVQVTHTGSIHALGEDSVGIWAQSIDGADVGCTQLPEQCATLPRPVLDGRGKDITITLQSGEIIGGSGSSGAGIFVSGGNTNRITNTGGRISALSGNAIIGTDGDDLIFNKGLIDGNVGLGGGANAFTNQAGGLFQTRKAVYLGAGGRLTNSGIVSPFGDAIGTTTVVGDFVQDANGVLRVNLDPGGVADQIIVQGAASLNGKIQPVVADVRALTPGQFATVLTATSLTNAGISVDAVNTLVIHYATRFQNNQFQIGLDEIRFDIDGLDGARSGLANHLQDLWEAPGATGFKALLDALAFETDRSDYVALLDSLNPYSALTQGNASIVSTQGFLSGMMSCPEAGGWTLHETSCAWVRTSYTKTEQDPTAGASGHRDTAMRLQGGKQFELGESWFAGFSAGYETGDFEQDNGASSSSDSLHLGGVLKRETGPLLLAAAADAGYSTAERNRPTGFPVMVNAESSSDTIQLSLRLRGAYTAELGGGFYLRPSVDIDGYHIRSEGFSETGAGALGLTVTDAEETLAAGTVSLEAGFMSKLGDALLHPYFEAGYTRLSTDTLDVTARFQGAPSGVGDFALATAIPQELVGGRIGIEALLPYGSLRLEYEHRQDDGYLSQSASAKVRFAF